MSSSRTAFSILYEFLPYLWQKGNTNNNRRVVIASILLIFQKMTAITVPLIYGWCVDIVAEENFLIATLLAVIGAYIMARLMQQLFDELKYIAFIRVAQNAIRTLALRTFRHLHQLSLSFHLDRQTGGLSRIIERGVKSIEFFLTFILFNIAPTALEILLVCGVFWGLFGWGHAAIAFITIGVYIVYTILLTEWRAKFRRRMNESDKTANTRAVDSLLNYETVKYFNAEEYEAQKYDVSLRRYENAAVDNRTSLSYLNMGQGLIIAAGMGIIMSLVGVGVAAEKYSIGLFAAVNMYLLQLYMPLNFLGSVYREIRQALIDMEEMFTLLKEPAATEEADAPALAVGAGRVEFRNVSFSYGRREILQNISFDIEGGKKLALVGASGAGKSTIARLLYRFYQPQQGAILIDGQDINACAQQSVRAAIGVVPQDTVLFNDTLRHNILYGDPAASEEDLGRAVDIADLTRFIDSLPEKYETMVGERGLKLSGGEKQRVAIARVLLKKPAIYLFDEATSALDTHTEKNIQTALNAISQTRTTLIIAHRLSTVVDADKIIVLQDGKIAESGDHQSLLARNAIYAGMWRQQKKHAEPL